MISRPNIEYRKRRFIDEGNGQTIDCLVDGLEVASACVTGLNVNGWPIG